MVMTHTHAKSPGQRSLGKQTDGQMNGKTEAIALPLVLTRYIIISVNLPKTFSSCDLIRKIHGLIAIVIGCYDNADVDTNMPKGLFTLDALLCGAMLHVCRALSCLL